MGPYFLLSNRKRAVIALVHSLAFLFLAIVLRPGPSPWLVAMYAVVTAVLVLFAALSSATKERLYFGFCAISAGVGLARVASSHPLLMAAPHLRVAALAVAAIVATSIIRSHSQA